MEHLLLDMFLMILLCGSVLDFCFGGVSVCCKWSCGLFLVGLFSCLYVFCFFLSCVCYICFFCVYCSVVVVIFIEFDVVLLNVCVWMFVF